ncbi:DUF4942 domain-containing protein [Enterococcus rivorum]|uniref:DUF4942 domain-containing protein n=1 Tax=Enterococcus rivorum TaxID=762845 RepID=A0A1E5L0C2_9ENTE|nr:DUF4942 domain-containing protein [Enterococcus rivorum]MBP2098826.1 hypothetical protein [Enterococcus rivorum]OEH83558.1 hypothetical protein BCR26_08750 [Enterococcus rivorum]
MNITQIAKELKVEKLLCKNMPKYSAHNNLIVNPQSLPVIEEINELNGRNSSHSFSIVSNEEDSLKEIKSKNFDIIAYDFLSLETYLEFNTIIMVPPIEQQVQYLMKAILLASTQVEHACFISSVISTEALASNNGTLKMLDKHNPEIDYYENLYDDGKTYAVISLVIDSKKTEMLDILQTSYNPRYGKSDKLETGLSTLIADKEVQNRMKEIRYLVSAYHQHVHVIKNFYKAKHVREAFESKIKSKIKEVTSRNTFYYHTPVSYSYESNINNEIMILRKNYWEQILQTQEFKNQLTSHGSSLMNEKIAAARKLEVTEENIILLLTALMNNGHEIILESCLEWFEKITNYHMNSGSKNIHYYNGWKTNKAHKINKKVIIPSYAFGRFYYLNSFKKTESFEDLNYSTKDYINDLLKMFKLLDPKVPTEFTMIEYNHFENDFMRFKLFAKGTMHIWFKDLELLEKLNFVCGQHYGWIPTSEDIKNKPEAQEFMNEHFSILGDTTALNQ